MTLMLIADNNGALVGGGGGDDGGGGGLHQDSELCGHQDSEVTIRITMIAKS